MSRVETPAVVTYLCDGCGREQGKPFDCRLKIIQTGRDYQGHAVGSNTVERDLCPTCTGKLNSFFTPLHVTADKE